MNNGEENTYFFHHEPSKELCVRQIFKQTTVLGVGRAVQEVCPRCRGAQNKGI